MFENFKNIRRNMSLAVLLYLVLGVILVVWPGSFIQFACNIIGALMIAFGVLTIIGEFTRHSKNAVMMFLGAFIGAIGIIIIANPELVSSIVPITFGIVLLINGLVNVRQAIGMHRYEEDSWMTLMILGIITLVLGCVILLHPYGTAQLAFRIMGAALIYSGLSDLFVIHKLGKAAKKYVDKDGEHDIIDVDVRPVDNDDEQ